MGGGTSHCRLRSTRSRAHLAGATGQNSAGYCDVEYGGSTVRRAAGFKAIADAEERYRACYLPRIWRNERGLADSRWDRKLNSFSLEVTLG